MEITSGTVAVITGGASGIGYALAEEIASLGGNVVLSDVRPAALDDAAAKLRAQYGVEVASVPADVSDATSVQHLADAAFDRFGEVGLLCNNAGLVSPGGPMWEQDASTWERMIGVKILGVVNGTRAFAPSFVTQGRGHVLNTASSGGLAPLPGRSPYSATMHAVVGLTETLDSELKAANPALGATVLCPGLVDTPLGKNSAELGAIVLDPNMPTDMRKLGLDMLSAREVAQAAITAVQAGRVHVAPGSGVYERAEARVSQLLNDLRDA